MNEITNKILEYKQTNSQKLLGEILKILNKKIEARAKFVYYRKWYPYNLYSKCKYCKECKYNLLPINEKREHCETCPDCICNRNYFNLKENHLCDYMDVKNDLIIEVIRMINSFDGKEGNFNKYFMSSIWNWFPDFITREFIENATYKSFFSTDEEGQEQILAVEDNSCQNNINSNLVIEHILKLCKNKNELKICKSYLENPNITQEELSKKLGVSQQAISLILKQLRKKLEKIKKYYL